MALPKPYGGKDIQELIRANAEMHREYALLEPKEDLSLFNPKVNGYGGIWTSLVRKDRLPGIYVVAGVSGNMTGVPIANFDLFDEQAAKRYERDFVDGYCFAIMNGERWCDYVRAAAAVRSLSTELYQSLMLLGRKTGISFRTGGTINQAELKAAYIAGNSASEI